MGIVLHHLNKSQSQRILWLLEELEVPYELKLYYRDPVTKRAPEELKKIHPLGKSPIIEDDGLVLAESGAIIDYLIAEYGGGRFVGQDKKARVMDQYWNHFTNGTANSWLMIYMVLRLAPVFTQQQQQQQQGEGSASSAAPALQGLAEGFIAPEVTKSNEHISHALAHSSNGWIVQGDAEGNPTAADFQLSWIPEFLGTVGVPLTPELQRYHDLIHSRPAWQRAIQKGGPFDMSKF